MYQSAAPGLWVLYTSGTTTPAGTAMPLYLWACDLGSGVLGMPCHYFGLESQKRYELRKWYFSGVLGRQSPDLSAVLKSTGHVGLMGNGDSWGLSFFH